jgi:hypothetical protein
LMTTSSTNFIAADPIGTRSWNYRGIAGMPALRPDFTQPSHTDKKWPRLNDRHGQSDKKSRPNKKKPHAGLFSVLPGIRQRRY